MNGQATATLLGRRLDRLRSEPGHVLSPDRARVDHAVDLARALNGTHVPTGAGAVVEFRHELDLPLTGGGLGALPYHVPAGRPLVCLDLETTGLATAAGTLAFLVGLGWWEGARFRVRQLLLADHADERAFLEVLAAALPSDACLVTYNGRCFDWPLIVARFRLHRRDPPPLGGHFDLLPVARQLWKHRLGTARLSTVEQAICGVARVNDLPGSLVPDRYFGYLRSRRGDLLREVVEHNRQDIISLGLLVATLERVGSRVAWPQMDPGDLFGLGRSYARRGRPAEALDCVQAALARDSWDVRPPGAAQLHRLLSAERARLLARLGRRDEAISAWREICARGGPGAAIAWLHVARHREHVERDVAGALAACHEAAAVAGRARAWGRPMIPVERDLERRLPRLGRKQFGERRGRRAEREIRPAA